MNRFLFKLLFTVVATVSLTVSAFAEVLYDYKISLIEPLQDNATEIRGRLDITNFGGATTDSISIPQHTDISANFEIKRTTFDNISIPLNSGDSVSINFTRKLEENELTKNFFALSSIMPITLRADKNSYRVSVDMPLGYTVFMSNDNYSETVSQTSSNFTFTFKGFLEDIELIGSTDYAVSYTDDTIIPLNTYFFNNQDNESNAYLELMDRYIREYMELFGVLFPYSQFSAVAVKMPIGYAMPTYTAIFDKIITQDFVKDYSLPHEILHQWFGVNIRVKGSSNWAEAMATYFGDQYQAEQRGDGADYRKRALIDYMRYLDRGEVFKLSEFRGNTGKASQTVGYGKGMFLLHMIKEAIGSDRFINGVTSFINSNMNGEAGWGDIFKSFDDNRVVTPIADYMLDTTSMIEINNINSKVAVIDGEYYINIAFKRVNGPAKLGIKYFIDYYDNDTVEKIYESKLGDNNISIKVTSPIATIYIDKDYDIFRKLYRDEIPKSFGLFRSLTDIVAIDDNGSCSELIKDFGVKTVKRSDDIRFSELSKGNYLICGNNPLLKLLLPSNYLLEDSNLSSYKVIDNPIALGNYIMLASNAKADNIRLLGRYGGLDKVYFNGNKVIDKGEAKGVNGILAYSYNRSASYIAEAPISISEALKRAGDYPVIFIGEMHTSFAHHLNQLDIIKEVYDSGKKIAVAFEMINKQFQPVLDNYTAGKLNEKEFLRGIEYYNRWKYDHTLYSPIFKFLQENKIKGLALNIDNDINRRIGRGGVESLSKEERAKLPSEMSLDNKEYYNELKMIFSTHGKGDSKVNDNDFANFYLAQNVWDESMAEEIYKYHILNPDTVIIVLAGGMHLNKNSGIPLRFKRLSGKEGLVILQDTDLDIKRADIVLSTADIIFPEIKKFGVSLIDETVKGKKFLKVAGIDNESVAYVAGMREGDIIIDCDKKPILDVTDLKIMLANLGGRELLSCTVDRKGNKINIDVRFLQDIEKQ